MDKDVPGPLALVHCGWPGDRDQVSRALGEMGVASQALTDVAELRRLVAEDRLDLVLADASGGLGPLSELLAALDDHPEARDLPLILLADELDAPLLGELTVRRFHATLLVKPVVRTQFEATVHAGLRYWARRRENRRLMAELREADRRKDEFLAMLGHELRNPLAAIEGAARVAAGAQDSAADPWALEVINRQCRHLARLVDDLLETSRVVQGKIELHRERIDAAAALRQAVEAARGLIEQKQHSLTVDLGPEPLWVEADPARLVQMVVNLLTNAARYTPAGGCIRLAAERRGDRIFIRVVDNGVGIPPEELPRVFDLFAQGERQLARTEGGLGIGLTLVKLLAELHGGRVSATSAGPGQGSEFVLMLPAADRPAPPLEPPKVDPPAAACRPARILVVDDSEDQIRILSRLLRAAGHDVWTARDGPSALTQADRIRPEFVVMDVGMPGMDGYQLASRIRREPWGRDAVLVAVTGYGQAEDRRRSEAAGIDHHLVKPLDYRALTEVISRKG